MKDSNFKISPMKTIGLFTSLEEKAIDPEVKVKVTRSSKMTLKRKFLKIFVKLGWI